MMAIPYVTEISAIVGASATLIALVASAVARLRSYGWWPQPISPDYVEFAARPNRVETGVVPQISAACKHAMYRIDEARRKLKQQTSLEMQYRWSGVSLIIGQYVVGGLLASSFIQQSFSRNVVGFLGLIVLAASIVRQQFHPELLAGAAKQRSAKLRALIRSSEDEMEELAHLTSVTAAQYHALARKVSSNLEDFDLNENGLFESLKHQDPLKKVSATSSSTSE